MVNQTTVCALLYGDYPELALRCLGPLAELVHGGRIELRIGANAISARTEEIISHLALGPSVFSRAPENIKKYPMMRRLLAFGTEKAISMPYAMWFDDDSYVKDLDRKAWLKRVEKSMETADMIGSRYRIPLTDSQCRWIRSQAWYTGKEVLPGPRTPAWFLTGGWWTIRTEVLRRFDWPIPELLHRGGDVMLGQLLHQQGLRMSQFNSGVAINADEKGKESAAKRRGFDSPPIGDDFC